MVDKTRTPFDNYSHGVGLRNVGSYQVSGHPYVTGSLVGNNVEHRVSFPFVTKSITVIASGTTADPLIRISFNPTGTASPVNGGSQNVVTGKHYIEMNSSGDSMTFDVKCKEIFIHGMNTTSGFELFASLTNVDPGHMYQLTGSGLTDLGADQA